MFICIYTYHRWGTPTTITTSHSGGGTLQIFDTADAPPKKKRCCALHVIDNSFNKSVAHISSKGYTPENFPNGPFVKGTTCNNRKYNIVQHFSGNPIPSFSGRQKKTGIYLLHHFTPNG